MNLLIEEGGADFAATLAALEEGTGFNPTGEHALAPEPGAELLEGPGEAWEEEEVGGRGGGGGGGREGAGDNSGVGRGADGVGVGRRRVAKLVRGAPSSPPVGMATAVRVRNKQGK